MEYDVALSFAGEDREYVKVVASTLVELGVRVFYDEYEKVALWGKDLYTHLQNVYKDKAKFTVMFISKHYAEKLWTSHERESAQARAFSEYREYILPARFDDTDVPGLQPTVHYIDLRETAPEDLAKMIKQKLELEELQPGTAYSKLSNQELAVKTLTLVGRMRESLYRMETMEREVNSMMFLGRSALDDQSHTEQLWQRQRALSDQLRLKLSHQYASEYKIEAILLRDEMLARLPDKMNVSRESLIEHTYEYPTSTYGVRAVVDDLEKLARSLP